MPEDANGLTLPSWADEHLPVWAKDGLNYLSQIWNEGAYGFTYGQIIIVVGIILLSLIIRGLFARTIVRAITRAAAGTKTKFDDALVKAIATPSKGRSRHCRSLRCPACHRGRRASRDLFE